MNFVQLCSRVGRGARRLSFLNRMGDDWTRINCVIEQAPRRLGDPMFPHAADPRRSAWFQENLGSIRTPEQRPGDPRRFAVNFGDVTGRRAQLSGRGGGSAQVQPLPERATWSGLNPRDDVSPVDSKG